MEDIKTLFTVNVGRRITLHLLGKRDFLEGEIEEAFEHYVRLKVDVATKWCVLYQGIVSVELRAEAGASSST